MAEKLVRVAQKGKGRGLLAIVLNDRDKPVGGVKQELRSLTASETVAAVGDSVRVQSPQLSAGSSHVGTERINTQTVHQLPERPHGIARETCAVTSHDSNADLSLSTQFENPLGYYRWTQGSQVPPRRGRGSQRPNRGHRLNRPNYREQKKHYQQLDTFLDDHKKGTVDADVKEMISRRKEKDRQKEERSRRSREALEEEMKKKCEIDEKASEEREQTESTPSKKGVKQADVECLQRQLQDVLKRMSVDNYDECKLEMMTILSADGPILPVSSRMASVMYTASPGLGQVQYVPVQFLPMSGAMTQMVAVQPVSPVAINAAQSLAMQQQQNRQADQSFTGFKGAPSCCVCSSKDHRTHECPQRGEKWFLN